MTIENTSSFIRYTYSGPGDYNFDFLVHFDTDLTVRHFDIAGVPTVLNLNSDYSVVKNEYPAAGGKVVTTAPVEAIGSLVLSRVLPLTQNVDWEAEGFLNLELIERSMDRVTMMIQQIMDSVSEGFTNAGSTWRESWASAASYNTRDMVEEIDIYMCVVPHVSGTFATDLAAGYWVLIFDRTSLISLTDSAASSEIDAEEAAIAAQAAQAAAESAAENIVAVWADDPTSYDMPDLVVGSDGYTYRCIGTGVVGEDPTTDDGTYWVRLNGPFDLVPAGVIAAFVGGYFTNGANAGFTNVIGNTASAVNTLLNASGWYVCNGAALNLSGSPIFDGASRYLPNLTDGRFLMGSTSAGTIGGAATHTHTTGSFTLTINEMPSHQHATNLGGTSAGSATGFHTFGGPATSTDKNTDVMGGGASHNHGATASASNNPVFMACFYLIKAI